MTTKTEALRMALEALGKAKRQIVHANIAPHGCIGEAITAIKEALAQPEQEPWLLESTQKLAKHLAREFYPEVPQWECLNDLAGVISQIDHMTTGLMRKSKQHRFFCSRCSKRLGLNTVHTCTPPQPTGWDNGLSQDYDKKLGAWFSEKPNAKEELRARTFDDYGNKIV